MAAAAKLLGEISFLSLEASDASHRRHRPRELSSSRNSCNSVLHHHTGCSAILSKHCTPERRTCELETSKKHKHQLCQLPSSQRARRCRNSTIAASQASYASSENEQSRDSAIAETSGQVVFQRHRSKTKFQYASSLERLGLARLSSTESQKAALEMGIEKSAEQETPVCVGFTVTKEGRGDLRLEGAVDTALDVPCARCACSVGVPIEGPFNLLLTAQPLKVVGRTVVGIVRGRKDQELEDLEEAEAVAGAQGDEAYDLDLDDKKYFPPEAAEIDLSEYIRETILLKVPIRVLCKEDCKGLCIDCGADWNKESCACVEKKKVNQQGGPKTNWGPALAQLRDQLRKES